MLQHSQQPEPNPVGPPPGDPRSLVFYAETFLSIVEAGTTNQVYAFWLFVIRTELQTITDAGIRAEALRLLQDVGSGSRWFNNEAPASGEALPLVVGPIHKLVEFLKNLPPPPLKSQI